MRLTLQLCGLVLAAVLSGCASKQTPKFGDVPPPSGSQPIVQPSTALTGRVASYNAIGRFAVLNFPVTRMPALEQTLFIFRGGLKVGEVKVTGPQKDDHIVADLVNGEVKPGDEVRDR